MVRQPARSGVSEVGARSMMIWRSLEPRLIVRLLRRAAVG